MNTLTFFKIGTLTTALLSSGNLLADELKSTPVQEKLQFQQQARTEDTQDQNAFRERVQTRVRTMTQEERRLMQDTGFNGRTRMTEETSRNMTKREPVQEGNNGNHGYGRGFESRQPQQATPVIGPSTFGSAGSGTGMGTQGASHSRGR